MSNPFVNLDDSALMEKYQQGSSKAFEVIYARYKDRVHAYLSKRMDNKEFVDDVFQNIFIKFHRARDKYDPQYPLIKWIYTLCRNELLDYLKKKNLSTVETDYSDIGVSGDEEIHAEFVVKETDIENDRSLTDKEKEAIKLRFFREEEYDEISKILKTSSSNARKIVSRGISKLKLKYWSSNG